MKVIPSKNQAGFALLMFVLAFMAIGGLLLIGFSEGMLEAAEAKKFEHNKRVLEEAKQALLQSAYNYPTTNDLGPGRLPNADDDNDGIPNGGSTFGRLPWAQQNLNLYDIRDADGERLWYAVSSSFRPQTPTPPGINSDTSGTITLRDQGGEIIYDGSNPGGLAQYGVAAVIIAPGAVTARNGVTQDRSVANVNDPVHYLDLVVGTEDNATVANGTTDGFILGPVDRLSTDAVNDQFIVITAAEVAEVAEQATLQAYRTAIDKYMVDTGGVYPWLYNYNVANYAELSSQYTAWDSFTDEKNNELTLGAGGNIGRIPSLFSDYFTEVTSPSTGIETEIEVEFRSVDILGAIKYNRSFPAVAIGNFWFVNTIWDGSWAGAYNFPGIDAEPNEAVTNFRFVDNVVDAMGADIDLIATFTQDRTYTAGPAWFWDGLGAYATGDWRRCDWSSNHIQDCHVDAARLPDPHGPGAHAVRVLKLNFTLTFDSSVADQYQITLDTDNEVPGSLIVDPPTSGLHAVMNARYSGAAFSTPMLVLDYEIDNDYQNGGLGNFQVDESGTLDYTTIANSEIELEVRYYPELPAWAFTNDWHNSMLLAYAADYRPGQAGPCIDGTDCIEVLLLPGDRDLNKIAVLINTGEHGWVDGNANGFDDDYADVFDGGNNDLDRVMRWRLPGGNDNLLILDEEP